jgi:RNA polymerase sigma factor (TIGR02999 family)
MEERADTVRLLRRMSDGDASASEALLSRVYRELHDIAAKLMAGERRDHTLQPTALIHDAWLRLVGGGPRDFEDRRHFLRVSARAMRRILVDHARARGAQKRGGGREPASLDDVLSVLAIEDRAVDLLALDEALGALGRNDPELLRVVELRYFAGLTLEETGDVLGMTAVQVHRAWAFARGWLRREMDATS